MRKIFVRLLALLTIIGTLESCNDFLNVRPKSSYPDYLMFSTQEGFIDAMNGTYMIMKQTVYNPYTFYYGGYNQSGGFFEYLGGSHVQSGSTLIATDANLYIHNYEYSSVISNILVYYKGQFKIVTNLNLILNWIDDEDQNFLSDEVYCMVKGEALALKSYIMFELIRAFGPPPSSTSLHNDVYIPYPKEVTIYPYKRETYTRFMELLWADIIEAEKLLEKYDPIISMSVSELNNVSDWHRRRNNKMNYYALMGLKARVQLWNGDKPGALASALTVIDAKNSDGSEKFPFLGANNYGTVGSANDMIGVSEHMFVIEHDNKMSSFDWKQSPAYFTTHEQIQTGPNPNLNFEYVDTPHSLHFKDLFPDARLVKYYGLLSQDIRMERWYTRFGTKLICVKYTPLIEDGHNTALPVLRKGEMLLIAAECEPSLIEASKHLNTLRQSRWLYTAGNANYGIAYTQVELLTEDDRKEWIIGEYGREFIMEGQSFFAWKRLNLSEIPFPSARYDINNALAGPIPMDDSKYIIPVPYDELNTVE